MKYRFIIEHRHDYAITLMCRVLRVARAGFYEWLRESVCDRTKEDARLLNLIRDSYAASRGGLWRTARVRRFARSWRKLRASSCRVPHTQTQDQAVRAYKAPRAIAGRPSIIAPNHLQRTHTRKAA